MKLQFKPEDFKNIFTQLNLTVSPEQRMSEIANKRLAEMLSSATVVYQDTIDDDKEHPFWDKHKTNTSTHKALLINIEPIVKECKHRPNRKYFDSTDRIFCECGVELVAEWKVKV